MSLQSDWEKLFQNAFQSVKEHLKQKYPLEEDGSGNPFFVAMRNVVDQIPCAIKVLLLEVDNSKFSHLKDNVCPMIYYDFERMNQLSVNYLGKFTSSDKQFLQILEKEFHFDDAEKFVNSFITDYKIMAQWDEDLSSNLQFIFYNPLNDPTGFEFDLNLIFENTFIPSLAQKVEVLPNYNQIYKLEPDAILSESELLTKNIGMDSFVVMEGNKTRKYAMTDLQKHVATIQLIPNVNEHVKKVFDKSKKLYVFGWYVYGFFPVAEHYATLALESAIKHRYFYHFGNQVIIKSKSGKTETMQNADYSRITELCSFGKEDGWSIHGLTVNGEKFLYHMNELLDWLVVNKIITKWERKRCGYKNDTRNYLSHPTFSPTYPAGTAFRTIEEVAYLINKMFSSQN